MVSRENPCLRFGFNIVNPKSVYLLGQYYRDYWHHIVNLRFKMGLRPKTMFNRFLLNPRETLENILKKSAFEIVTSDSLTFKKYDTLSNFLA